MSVFMSKTLLNILKAGLAKLKKGVGIVIEVLFAQFGCENISQCY